MNDSGDDRCDCYYRPGNSGTNVYGRTQIRPYPCNEQSRNSVRHSWLKGVHWVKNSRISTNNGHRLQLLDGATFVVSCPALPCPWSLGLIPIAGWQPQTGHESHDTQSRTKMFNNLIIIKDSFTPLRAEISSEADKSGREGTPANNQLKGVFKSRTRQRPPRGGADFLSGRERNVIQSSTSRSLEVRKKVPSSHLEKIQSFTDISKNSPFAAFFSSPACHGNE